MNKQLFINIVEKLHWIDQVVGGVWVVLSLLMIVSAWAVYKQNGFNRDFWFIIALVAATWTYPLYTLGFQQVPGLIGNILYIAFAVYAISQVRHSAVFASYLLYPQVVWVSIASIYVACQILAK